MEHPDLPTAVQLAQQGEHSRAYRLLCRVLREEPGCVSAWLWMSAVVSDVARQLQCLERALQIDPACAPARAGLAHLRRRLSPSPSELVDRGTRWQLGRYLVQYGFVSEQNLQEVLAEQMLRDRNSKHELLGTLLLRRGLLTPHGLATALMMQAREQLFGHNPRKPERFGEYLVVQGYLTVEQLATVLAQQIQQEQNGTRELLGTLLRRNEYVTPQAIEQAVRWWITGHTHAAAA